MVTGDMLVELPPPHCFYQGVITAGFSFLLIHSPPRFMGEGAPALLLICLDKNTFSGNSTPAIMVAGGRGRQRG